MDTEKRHQENAKPLRMPVAELRRRFLWNRLRKKIKVEEIPLNPLKGARIAFSMKEEKGVMKDLKGKTAFITGGASGIGLGIAKACAKYGMNVVIADMSQASLDERQRLF